MYFIGLWVSRFGRRPKWKQPFALVPARTVATWHYHNLERGLEKQLSRANLPCGQARIKAQARNSLALGQIGNDGLEISSLYLLCI